MSGYYLFLRRPSRCYHSHEKIYLINLNVNQKSLLRLTSVNASHYFIDNNGYQLHLFLYPLFYIYKKANALLSIGVALWLIAKQIQFTYYILQMQTIIIIVVEI